MTPQAPLTYRKSGVNIDLADKLVDHIQKKAPAIGGFAGLFPLDLDGSGPWDLVACTDGVGTKLKLAFALDKHDTIGIDLVAMSVKRPDHLRRQTPHFSRLLRHGKAVAGALQAHHRRNHGGLRRGRCVLLGGETRRCPGCIRRANTIWPASRSAS